MNNQTDLASLSRAIDSGAPIPASLLLDCMNSSDLETQGAAMYVICNRYPQVSPPLEGRPIWDFAERYFVRCMLEDPRGEFAENRYQAGDTLVHWFKGLWKDTEVPREVIEGLKKMLAALYLRGDEALKEAVVNATLEHLFEVREIAQYFEDWKSDPVLATAHELAIEWGRDHWASAPNSG